MGSSFHEWESDPLFSAAEVVQDSADRMESLFRLLLHQQSLIQSEHPDPRLLSSIEYHKRDLVTILGTAKWQLEDFERAVNSSIIVDKTQTREDVISRHRQFIIAIREHINEVEKSVKGPSMGDSMRNSEWVNLNDQDRDMLASFLTGANPTEHLNRLEIEESSIFGRFLDPNSGPSLKDNEIVEHDSREFERVKMNGVGHVDHYLDSAKEDKRNVGSHYSTRSGSSMMNSLQEIPHDMHGGSDHWDLEANEAKSRSFFHEIKSRGIYSIMIVFGFLSNLWTTHRNRFVGNHTKRLKDGEENRHSPTYAESYHSAQGQRLGLMLRSGYRSLQGICFRLQSEVMHLGSYLVARYERFPFHFEFNRHSMKMILTTILTLVFLGILVSRIA
ncbi:unnamed protein product [Dovyalis caffra]|uniref:Syntaxin 6/10/61 N-terminal domain-containing protein n=1 Tax=Dovyalis caffra TaxID=77055 RepID=A0AAV1S3P2_9ROSI|nr:unnamed protein product [Dovyalis caffra]